MNWLKEKLLESVKLLNQTPKASTDLSKLTTRIEDLEKEVYNLRKISEASASSLKTVGILMDGLAQNQKSIALQVQNVMDGLEIVVASFYESDPIMENNDDEWN